MSILYKAFFSTRTAFCTLLAGFLLAFSPVQAADPAFTVQDVQVDVTAASALAARDQAFTQAQQDAFKLLAQRMITPEAYVSFVPPDNSVISPMIQDYEVTKEKLSSVRYIGTYTFRFRQRAVQKYFNQSGVEYTDISRKPMLLLPFYQQGDKTSLWSPYNIWMKAWNRAGSSGAALPLVMPIGDLADVSDLPEDDALGYNPGNLISMLSRYGAGEAVIMVAAPDASLAKAAEGAPSDGGKLTVSLYRTDRDMPEHIRDIEVYGVSGMSMSGLMDSAVGTVKAALGPGWKQKSPAPVPVAQMIAPAVPPAAMQDTAPQGRVLARVKISNLGEWAAIQQRVARVYTVTSATLKSLSPREALVEISYRGSEESLRLMMRQAGMSLSGPGYTSAGYGGAPVAVYELTPALPQAGRPAAPAFPPRGVQSPPAGGYVNGF